MKANDLMIGDWVWYDNQPYQIRQLGIFGENRDGDDYPAVCVGRPNGVGLILERNEIEPISLTQEILEKNGFSSLNDEMFSACETETYSNQELKIYLSHIGCEYNPVQLVVYMGYEPQERVVLRMMPCQYVHELQHALRLCKIEKEIGL